MKRPEFLRTKSGFTLVELLVVIVVIAILASISVIAYRGIQERALNVAIKSDVNQVAKLLMLYKTGEGAYPTTTDAGYYCATLDHDCRNYAGVAINDAAYREPFFTKIKAYGSLPATVKKPHPTYYGISVTASSSYTLKTKPSPIMVVFFLKGKDQNCADVPGMVSVGDNGNNDFGPRRNSNSDVKNTGITRCYAMFSAS